MTQDFGQLSLRIAVSHDRHIALDGACNMRDLGGYPSRHGGHVRWGRLLRADGLYMLTTNDRHRLHEMGLRTVIDLRFAGELLRAPNVYATDGAVDYCHIPLHDDKTLIGAHALPQDVRAYYHMLIDEAGLQLSTVIERIARLDALPAVVHCTLGKDRTGLVAALMLDLLGVPHDLIVQDYALTALYARPLLKGLRERLAGHGPEAEWHLRMLRCEPQSMASALAHLYARYGSAANYLVQHGLDPRTPAHLRHELLAHW